MVEMYKKSKFWSLAVCHLEGKYFLIINTNFLKNYDYG